MSVDVDLDTRAVVIDASAIVSLSAISVSVVTDPSGIGDSLHAELADTAIEVGVDVDGLSPGADGVSEVTLAHVRGGAEGVEPASSISFPTFINANCALVSISKEKARAGVLDGLVVAHARRIIEQLELEFELEGR